MITIKDFAAAFPMAQPLKTMVLAQGFGENAVSLYAHLGLKGHDGQDYAIRNGTECYAVMNGIVSKVRNRDEGYGKYLFLKTETKQFDGVRCFVEVVYGHLQECLVTEGQEVTEGQKVALTDNTGWSTGSHLHLGTRVVHIIDAEERRLIDNGYFGYSDPALFLTKNLQWEQFPVDRQYGIKRSLIRERMFAFSPKTRIAFGRLPTAREISAYCYGAWDIPDLLNPAMFATWREWTVTEYRARLQEMIAS